MFNNLIFDFKHDNTFKGATIGFIFFLFFPILYWLTRNEPPEFPDADLLFNMWNNVAYGYIASFFFYMMNIYFPNTDRTKSYATNATYRISVLSRKAADLTNYTETLLKAYPTDLITVVEPDGKKRTISKENWFEGNRKILIKDVERIKVFLKEDELRGELVQHIENTVKNFTFHEFTFSNWVTFYKLTEKSINSFYAAVSTIDSPQAREITKLKHIQDTPSPL
ncbi:hypothetical protein [Halodesulfovibrio spirochaetisodalis]|uniref:Uncharacterized protein n=1 Tax=Halodesulfovibrio spirochaetisodalis TaxID=1560234 RepID=A0A1B7X9Q5_9BACT|nr:hypothetical protein [Halodesulfovibrio spirochaetisodalis]OBQ46030.1 hypothetical protein SP90_14770 [Halodesulfovibrio spirochaetisodalis]